MIQIRNGLRALCRDLFVGWVAFLCLVFSPAVARSEGSRIAVVVDGQAEPLQQLLATAQAELASFGYEGASFFPVSKLRTGDFTLQVARQQLAESLADPEVDVIWAFGLFASAAAVERATRGPLEKPVLAPFVPEPALASVRDLGRPNFSAVLWTPSISRDLKAMRVFQPIRRVAYLVPPPIRDAFPSFARRLRAEAAKLDVQLVFASSADPEALVRDLPSDIDAVFIAADPQRGVEETRALASALIARRLPSFSQFGRAEVEQGVLMGLGSRENAEQLARMVAVNTDAILQGETPGDLTSAFKQAEALVVNSATAESIGLSLSWEVLSEAELIGDVRRETDIRVLGLYDVVREVRDRNLELRANEEELEASRQSVRESFGALLPSLDGSVSGDWSDPDAATGANPERRLSWSGSASQTVINEPALAQLTINEHLRDATLFDNGTAILDTVRSAAVAYLNVLSAATTEKVQRDNLRLTRTELAQARLRQLVGSGSRSEVVRLESQLANNRTSVIDAVASRNVEEIELRRLLNLSSEEPIRLDDVSLADSQLMASVERLQSYMTGPDRFRQLRTFMAREALDNSPELRAQQSRLAAQNRELLSNQLATILPQVSVTGSVTDILATAGAGTSDDDRALFPLNDVDWQLGVTASWSLWEGNARYARIDRARAEANGQLLDLEAQRIEIEANLRSTLHRAGASYAAINIQRQAADAAEENLQLVSESFARGKSDIVTLVDAQNQALTAKLDANTAIYEFLIDLLDVQRASGRFDFFMSGNDVEDFFRRLKAFAYQEQTRDR